MTLEVRHLSLVKAVAREGNISRAGIHLNLTQSALSHQLRSIEERLGVQLFLRHNKRMTLSSPGMRLLESADRILEELQRVEEVVRRMASNNEGTLRICTQCYTAYHWLPSVLKVFRNKFPNVDVQIVTEATSRPFEYLIERKLDLAIVPETVPERQIAFEPLFQDNLVVITHPEHPLAMKRHVKVRDFADENLFIHAQRIEEYTFYNTLLAPVGIIPKRVSQVPLTEGIIEMVKAGLGIAVLARWAIDPELRQRTIRALPLTQNGFMRQWSAATLRNGPMPAYMDSFIKMLAHRDMPAMKYY